MEKIIGIDLGTTNVKAVVFSMEGEVLGLGRSEIEELFPSFNSSEHSLASLWDGFIGAVRTSINMSGAKKEDIIGMGFSTNLGCFNALDETGTPLLKNFITWKDRRSSRFINRCKGDLGEDEYINRIGGKISGSLLPARMALLDSLGVDNSQVAKYLLSVKQWIIYRLTGEHSIDLECARASGVYNIKDLCWQKDQFMKWGLTEDKLPSLHKCHSVVGKIDATRAPEISECEGVPVVVGGGDGLMSTVGSGIISEGIAAASIGTITGARGFKRDYSGLSQHILDCKILPGIGFYNSAITLTGGLALNWYRKRLGIVEEATAKELGSDPYDLICEQASKSKPGCNGMVFLPPSIGEGKSSNCDHPIGSFIGVLQQHTRRDFARAIMEGIAYAVNEGIEALYREGHNKFHTIRLGGGGSKSSLWRSIVADTTGIPVETISTEETGSLGAAIMAAWGIGIFSELDEAINSMVHVATSTVPDPSNIRIYQENIAKRRCLKEAMNS